MDALKIDCPVCGAKKGEMCMPGSLVKPHLARIEEQADPRGMTTNVVPFRRRGARDLGRIFR